MRKIIAWGNPQNKMVNDKNQDVKLFCGMFTRMFYVHAQKWYAKITQVIFGCVVMSFSKILIILFLNFQIFYNEYLFFL